MRRRVSISVNEELYQALQRITAAYRFRSACELGKVALQLLVNKIEHSEALAEMLPADQCDEIGEMFSALADHEATPFNTEVPQTHRAKR